MSDLMTPSGMAKLGAALDDADMLLEYAASMGLATIAGETVSDIEHARQAWRENQVTAHVATAFWLAYANLASITSPVTAASVRTSRTASLRSAILGLVAIVGFAIVFSIFVFANNTIATETAKLIEEQNAAALRLWVDLQPLQSLEQLPTLSMQMPADYGAAVFQNRIFEEAVEFSRRSQSLLEFTTKLHSWFNPWLTSIDAKATHFDQANPEGITHLLIPPDTLGVGRIKVEVTNQISAFQSIRSYALAVEKADFIIYGGITTFLLPTVYALLGAFLYGFRLYSRLICTATYILPSTYSAR